MAFCPQTVPTGLPFSTLGQLRACIALTGLVTVAEPSGRQGRALSQRG